jgi:hypothetical protein
MRLLGLKYARRLSYYPMQRSSTYILTLFLSLTALAGASPVIKVTPAVAPNVFGSPSYAGWLANAVNAIENGLATNGAAGPAQYNAQSVINFAKEAVVTGFPSWQGEADPGTVFGPAYANELGNRPLFGLLIDGNGEQFSISQLSFSVAGDSNNLLDFNFAAGSYNYNAGYVGFLNNGAGPRTYITSGPNTQLVDGLIGRGSGNANAAYCPGCDLIAQQAAIDAAGAELGGLTSFTGTYTLSLVSGDVTGSGTLVGTPEPGSFLMLTGGLLVVPFLRRLRLAPKGEDHGA